MTTNSSSVYKNLALTTVAIFLRYASTDLSLDIFYTLLKQEARYQISLTANDSQE